AFGRCPQQSRSDPAVDGRHGICRAQRPAPRSEAWSWLISLAGSAGGSGNASLDQHFEEARIIAGAAWLLADVEHFACACIDNAIGRQDGECLCAEANG